MIHELLAKTWDEYGIASKTLAEITGFDASYIRSVKAGRKWVSEEGLEKILAGMEELAPGSRLYFCSLLAGEDLKKAQCGNVAESLQRLISVCDSEEINIALLAISTRLREVSQRNPYPKALISA